MADKITWIRPSGREITTNGDAGNIKYAAEHGWKLKGEAAPVAAPAAAPTAAPSKKRGG